MAERGVERRLAAGPARARGGDRVFEWLTWLACSALLLLVAALVVALGEAARPALEAWGLSLFVDTVWDPVAGRLGGAGFLIGTAAVASLALMLAVPVGLGVALWSVEIAPERVRRVVGAGLGVLAAVPSVVYGLWGMAVVVPLWAVPGGVALDAGYGPSLGAGAIVLAVMVLPTFALLARDLLRTVPTALRESALALGATPWEVTRHVALPSVRRGLAGAAVLALGRALGETMAMAMLLGGRPTTALDLAAPAASMAGALANRYLEAPDTLAASSLAALGLLLFALTLAAGLVARAWVTNARRRLESYAAEPGEEAHERAEADAAAAEPGP